MVCRGKTEIKDSHLVKAIDSYGIEGFGHVQEHRSSEALFAKIPSYFFKEAGQLQRRAMSMSKPKMLVPQQPTLAYFI
jgi:hypothetical protein